MSDIKSQPADARYADRTELRQSEILVLDQRSLPRMTRLGVIDDRQKVQANELLAQADGPLQADVMQSWCLQEP